MSAARKTLQRTNLGVIGAPSDWLISSHVDRAKVAESLGIDFVDIPVAELIELYNVSEPSSLSAEEVVKNDVSGVAAKYAEGALKIYRALKTLVEKYKLSGLTLRCFDLLDSLGNTGCLALAMLNAEGIPAGCEGDMPTLLTMAVGNALTGQCGFQCNPSRIDPEAGEMLLAHCTVPFNMVLKHSYNTHFESGIGVAIHGELPLGPSTIFKLSGDLSRVFCTRAELTSNPYENNLCRTQIEMKLMDEPQKVCKEYFLRGPIGNHHVVFIGDHSDLFNAFFDSLA